MINRIIAIVEHYLCVYVYYKKDDNYYGIIYENQLELFNECKYKYHFKKLNDYFIPELNNIICEYLVEN